MMLDLTGSHLCLFYPNARALTWQVGFIPFLPAGFKAETWPSTPEQVSNSPHSWVCVLGSGGHLLFCLFVSEKITMHHFAVLSLNFFNY